MIIAGAALIMLVLDRFPILVWLGACCSAGSQAT